jgi:hypothetical protein
VGAAGHAVNYRHTLDMQQVWAQLATYFDAENAGGWSGRKSSSSTTGTPATW